MQIEECIIELERIATRFAEYIGKFDYMFWPEPQERLNRASYRCGNFAGPILESLEADQIRREYGHFCGWIEIIGSDDDILDCKSKITAVLKEWNPQERFLIGCRTVQGGAFVTGTGRMYLYKTTWNCDFRDLDFEILSEFDDWDAAFEILVLCHGLEELRLKDAVTKKDTLVGLIELKDAADAMCLTDLQNIDKALNFRIKVRNWTERVKPQAMGEIKISPICPWLNPSVNLTLVDDPWNENHLLVALIEKRLCVYWNGNEIVKRGKKKQNDPLYRGLRKLWNARKLPDPYL